MPSPEGPWGPTSQSNVLLTTPSIVWPLRSTVMLSVPITSPSSGQLVRLLASLTLCVSVCPQLTVSGGLACAGPAKSASAANTLSVRNKRLQLTVLITFFIAAPCGHLWVGGATLRCCQGQGIGAGSGCCQG